MFSLCHCCFLLHVYKILCITIVGQHILCYSIFSKKVFVAGFDNDFSEINIMYELFKTLEFSSCRCCALGSRKIELRTTIFLTTMRVSNNRKSIAKADISKTIWCCVLWQEGTKKGAGQNLVLWSIQFK